MQSTYSEPQHRKHHGIEQSRDFLLPLQNAVQCMISNEMHATVAM